MKSFKAGIVGCGNIGGRYDERDRDNNIYTHAGMYREIDQFDLICVAERDAERLDTFGRFWKVPRLYKDHEEMFQNERLDIISIATPDETHDKIILDAIKYNPPRIIFTEKPLAVNFESAVKVYEECQKKNVALFIDYIRRWDKTHQDIKRFILDGELGPVQAIVGYYVRGLRHNGCQMINLIRFLFGKIISVQVMGASDLGSFEGDPSMNIRLILENGVEAQMIALDRKGYGFSMYEIDILGRKGRLRLLEGGQRIEQYKADTDPQFSNFNKLYQIESPWKESTYGSAMIRAGKQFVSFLTGKTQCL